MNRLIVASLRFWRNQDGGELVEWPLVMGMLALGLIATFLALREQILAVLNLLVEAFSGADT